MAVATPPNASNQGATSTETSGNGNRTDPARASSEAKGDSSADSGESNVGAKFTSWIKGIAGRKESSDDGQPDEQTASRSTRKDATKDQSKGQQGDARTREQKVRGLPDDELKRLRVEADTPDERRWSQSELDRREATRKRAADQKKEADHARWLRDNDPEAYADLARKREQQTNEADRTRVEVQAYTHRVLTTYDETVLDPIFNALPEADREKVLKKATGMGLEQRQAFVSHALDHLHTIWMAEGEAKAQGKLRSNPVFLQRVAQERRRADEEPEHVAATKKAQSGKLSASDWLRKQAGRYTGPDDEE